MRIGLGFITQNSLQYVKMTLPKSLWADQICVLDMNSVDGTEEYCKSILRPGDIYTRRYRNTIPVIGWAEAHNSILSSMDCDWNYVSAINMLVDWNQADLIRNTL